jgi:hypothetical protein
MPPVNDKPRHSLRVAIVLTMLAGAIATAVAYLGIRQTTPPPVAPLAGQTDTSVPVLSIVLPHDDPEVPSGPHQRTFATSCMICHSPRLVLTQPPFPRKEWVQVVLKMVKTYGAPITPEDQEQIVDYLAVIRGE